MALKYNYNNPIMSQHLQNAQNKKHIHVSDGRQVQHQIATGGNRGTGVQVTTVYVTQGTDNSSSSSSSSSGMSTAEKFALGASILTGGLKGAAEIISAIKEVKASSASSSTPTTTSTSTDNTSYSSGSGTSGASDDFSFLTGGDSTSVSNSAKKLTGNISKYIKAYQDENDGNSNVKDRQNLEGAVKKAISDYNSNKGKITTAQTNYDNAVKAREDFEKTIESTDKKYDEAVKDLTSQLSTGKYTSVDDAKRTLADKEGIQTQKQTAYDDGVKDVTTKETAVTDCTTARDNAKAAVEDAQNLSDDEIKEKYGKTKAELDKALSDAEESLKTAKRELEEAKDKVKQPDGELYKALEDAKKETETARGDLNVSNEIARTLKEKQTEHDKNVDTLNNKYKKDETKTKTALDKTKTMQADNEALKKTIQEGNKALKDCAVSFTE